MPSLGAERDLRYLKPTASDSALLGGRWRQHSRYRGCVGHWLLGEGGGRIVHDSSVYGQHGQLTNIAPVPWAPGQYGAVPVFDGVDQFVTVPSAPQFDLSGDFTFVARSRIDILAGDGSDVLVAKVSDAGETQFYWAILTSGDIYFSYYNAGPQAHTFVVPDAAQEGREYLYGLTLRGASLQAYRDGLPVGAPQTKTSTMLPHAEPMTFGSTNPTLAFPTTGAVHDVRLYNVGLSAEEMLSFAVEPWLEWYPSPVVGRAGVALGDTFPAWLATARRLATRQVVVGIEY